MRSQWTVIKRCLTRVKYSLDLGQEDVPEGLYKTQVANFVQPQTETIQLTLERLVKRGAWNMGPPLTHEMQWREPATKEHTLSNLPHKVLEQAKLGDTWVLPIAGVGLGLDDWNQEGPPRGDRVLPLDEGSGSRCTQTWYNFPNCRYKRHILLYVIRAFTYACVCAGCRNHIATSPFDDQDGF